LKKERTFTARKVATLRDQFTKRQKLINEAYKLTLERASTLEKQVTSDLNKLDYYYMKKAEQLQERYGNKIGEFQLYEIVENVYLKYETDSNGKPTSKLRD